MADGSTKAIEDVVVGDEVLSSDGTTTVGEPVTDLIRHLDGHSWVDLTIVTLAGSEAISATAEHPFWVVARAEAIVGASTIGAPGTWTNAIDLNTGDVLTTAEGTAALVVAATTRQSTDWAYNLTIANTHTYYVGDQPVLVHNSRPDACGLPGMSKGKLHGDLPPNIPTHVGLSDLMKGHAKLSKSVATRVGEKSRFGRLDAGHARRLASEQRLLAQVVRRIGSWR